MVQQKQGLDMDQCSRAIHRFLDSYHCGQGQEGQEYKGAPDTNRPTQGQEEGRRWHT